MLSHFRSSFIEKIIKSNVLLLLIADKLIENFKFLLPYEEDWFFFKKYKIPKHSVIIDIGAHWGESALTFRKYYKQNTIYSFEPNLYSFKKLKKNTKNLLNIKIFNYGISKNESDYLYYPYYRGYQLSLWTSKSLIKLKKRIKDYTFLNEKKIIYKKSLSKFNKLPIINNKVSIIKIDVEGDEYNVINMISHIIKKNNPLIFIEYNKTNFYKINKFFKKNSYHLFYYFDDKLIKIKKKNELESILIKKKKRSLNLFFLKNVNI